MVKSLLEVTPIEINFSNVGEFPAIRGNCPGSGRPVTFVTGLPPTLPCLETGSTALQRVNTAA